MKRTFLIVVFLLFAGSLSAQITTTSDGNWQDGATWGGSAPDNMNLNTNATINHKVVLVGDLHLTSLITLTVNDVLVIYGDVYLDNNKCQILLNSGASLVVYGNFTFDNPNQLVLVDGDLLITGQLTLTNSVGNTNLDINGGRVFATGGVSGASVSGTVYNTLPTDPNDPINLIDAQYDVSQVYVLPATISGCEGSSIAVRLQGLSTSLFLSFSIVVKKSGMSDIVLVDKASGFSSLGATWMLDRAYTGGYIEGEVYLFGVIYLYSINQSLLDISGVPVTNPIQRVP